MIDDYTTALVNTRRLELAREACAHRLARLATCCQPSHLRARTTAVLDWLRHGQLGKGYEYAVSAPPTTRGCTC